MLLWNEKINLRLGRAKLYLYLLASVFFLFSCKATRSASDYQHCEQASLQKITYSSTMLSKDIVKTDIFDRDSIYWFIKESDKFGGPVSPLEIEAMEWIGLDPAVTEDLTRILYLARQINYIFAGEHSQVNSLTKNYSQEIALYVYDLDSSELLPNQAISVIDFSILNSLDATEARRKIRELIDEMINNGKPDAIAMKPPLERTASTEKFIPLSDPASFFASSGSFTFQEFWLYNKGSVAVTWNDLSIKYDMVSKVDLLFSAFPYYGTPYHMDIQYEGKFDCDSVTISE